MTLLWIDLAPDDRDVQLVPVTICLDCGEEPTTDETTGRVECPCGPIAAEHL